MYVYIYSTWVGLARWLWWSCSEWELNSCVLETYIWGGINYVPRPSNAVSVKTRWFMYLARTYVTQNQQLMHCQIYSDTLFLFLSFSLSLFSLSLSLSLSLSHAHKRANLQSHITQTHAYTFTCIVHTHSHTQSHVQPSCWHTYVSTPPHNTEQHMISPSTHFSYSSSDHSFLLPFGLSPGSFLGTAHALTHTRAHAHPQRAANSFLRQGSFSRSSCPKWCPWQKQCSHLFQYTHASTYMYCTSLHYYCNRPNAPRPFYAQMSNHMIWCGLSTKTPIAQVVL